MELVRHAVFGFRLGSDLGHVGALLLFAALMWFLAVPPSDRLGPSINVRRAGTPSAPAAGEAADIA